MDIDTTQLKWINQIENLIGSNERLQVIPVVPQRIWILYLEYAIDSSLIYQFIVQPLQQIQPESLDTIEDILAHVQIAVNTCTFDVNKMADSVLQGQTLLVHQSLSTAILFKTAASKGRSPSAPEIESQIFGPQSAFVESLDQNLQTIVRMIPDIHLKTENVQLGRYTKTDVTILYMDNIAQLENTNRLLQRLKSLEIDGIYDSSMLLQFLNDNTNSVLPQMILTERPDRVVSNLLEGKLVLLVNGSAQAIITPCNFIDFFKSTEDIYLNWSMATFLRLLRMSGLFLSLFITPLYVAVLTYHYSLVPENMLITLIESRTKVPFSPVLEVLFLELIIELLREAGIRLPTKVGQTLGIVGGIVIGQATVQAGFTSNILLILVALTALSNSIVPFYMMGAAIRLIRFPMIIMAGYLGLLGIVLAFSFLLLHMLRLSSLEKPYLFPFYPLRKSDLKDSVVRLPFNWLSLRSHYATDEAQTRLTLFRNNKSVDIYEHPLTGRRESNHE